MICERERLVRTFFAALSDGDIDAALSLTTADVVLDRQSSSAPWRGVTRGHAEARRVMVAFRDAWDEFEDVRWHCDQVRPVGRGFAAALTHLAGRGRRSGIPLSDSGGWTIRFEDGLLAEVVLQPGLAEALLDARRRALAAARLYFVCEALPHGRDPGPLLEAAIRGGAEVVQLREKAPRCAEELLAFAEPFARAAREHGALFFLNDTPELVEACGADGVHVGQDDAPVAEARAAAGAGALVGLSTHSPQQFDAALAASGAARPDQLSAGPVWETPTKLGRPAAGIGLIAHAASRAPDIPWFAIGGIDLGNVAEVVAAGAARLVIVRAIRDAADPEAAARELRAALP